MATMKKSIYIDFVAYDKAVDLFEKIPYKHFLTKEYSTKVHLSVFQCLFKYHLFVKLNEEQWEVLVDFLHHSNSVKLGLSLSWQPRVFNNLYIRS